MSDQEEKKQEEKKDAGQILTEELLGGDEAEQSFWSGALRSIQVPLLAVVSGLILGGVFIFFTTETVYAGWAVSPFVGIGNGLEAVFASYIALFNGSIGNLSRVISALQSGEAEAIRWAFNPFLESLVTSTPLIFASLAVALGFRAGLFNIGAEGQLFVGAIFSAFVGYSLQGIPAIIHIPLALLAGAIGGGIWGFIPGFLKARTGGHEVINTIMMNFIAIRLSEWLLSGPMQRPESFNPISPTISESAMLPRFFGYPTRFHLGFFIALGVAWLVYWLLFRTTWGFDLRTAGSSPRAARYAGMNTLLSIVMAMTISGALAGLAGANEVLGVNHNLALAFSAGTGFDAIALALLGKSHPVGVVLAALLFGFLRNGSTQMQISAGIPVDIIAILQAMILMFIAAPAIIRTIYRLREPAHEEEAVSIGGWGGG